jgi:uncharacterized membrane protein YqjE
VKRLAGLALAFALLVAGIESLHVLVAWWQAGRPPAGWAEILSFLVLIVAGVAWWRRSVFTCADASCRLADAGQPGPPERR